MLKIKFFMSWGTERSLWKKNLRKWAFLKAMKRKILLIRSVVPQLYFFDSLKHKTDELILVLDLFIIK